MKNEDSNTGHATSSVMTQDYASFLPTMIQAAEAAGILLREHFSNRQALQVTSKHASDFVSQADVDAENRIVQILQTHYPEIGARLEEGGAVSGGDDRLEWIIDPLDGTTNFINGIAHYAVSIALADRGHPVAGVVLNPESGELFSGAEGNGAALNGRKISVLTRTDLPDMLLATGFPFRGKNNFETVATEMERIMPETAGIRRIGAAALDLCFVAAGRFDAYWEHNLQPWDVAAGVVIVREAGGLVTSLAGQESPLPYKDILAASQSAYPAVAAFFP